MLSQFGIHNPIPSNVRDLYVNSRDAQKYMPSKARIQQENHPNKSILKPYDKGQGMGKGTCRYETDIKCLAPSKVKLV